MKYAIRLLAAIVATNNSLAYAGNFEAVWVPDDIVVVTEQGWADYCAQWPRAERCVEREHNTPTPPDTPTCKKNCGPVEPEPMSKADALYLLAGVETYQELPRDTAEERAFRSRVKAYWESTGKHDGIKDQWAPFYEAEKEPSDAFE